MHVYILNSDYARHGDVVTLSMTCMSIDLNSFGLCFCIYGRICMYVCMYVLHKVSYDETLWRRMRVMYDMYIHMFF